MRKTKLALVLCGLASSIPHCAGQSSSNTEDSASLLGRIFGLGGGILSRLPTQVGPLAPQQTSAAEGGAANTEFSDNLQFMTCTQSTACYNDSTQTPGAWTCRPQAIGHISLCVPTILGVTLGREGDTCGCCGGVCPKKCECSCTNARGVEGVMTRFNLLFGLLRFDQCLEPTVADAATSFNTLDISCSDVCNQAVGRSGPEEEEEVVETTTTEEPKTGGGE